MDYRDQVFLTVAEKLSFSKAAEELFISQPAVTKHIKELESKLGVALFDRKGNKVYLSPGGELAYRHLKTIRHNYREMEFEISKLSGDDKGSLIIGASSTISQYTLPALLASFHLRFPKIRLGMISGNSSEMELKLINDDIDLALVENNSSQSNINYQNFMDDEIIPVTGKNSIFATKKRLSLNDLKSIPVILREPGSGTLEVIQKHLIAQNIEPDKLNIIIHLGSTESIKNYLSQSDAIGFLSEKAIEKEIQFKLLFPLRIHGIHIVRNFRIATRQGPELHTSELFRQFLMNQNQ